MRQSKAEIYLHFVWATYERLPLLTPDIEREVSAASFKRRSILAAWYALSTECPITYICW